MLLEFYNETKTSTGKPNNNELLAKYEKENKTDKLTHMLKPSVLELYATIYLPGILKAHRACITICQTFTTGRQGEARVHHSFMT